jgi:branched-chain amino acid transport system substrate-binding protein
MSFVRRLASVFVTLVSISPLTAYAADKVVIGDIDDLSGLYADINGPRAVEGIKMAIADFGGAALGQAIELLTADHQNKPDIAAAIARQWYDNNGVDMITDLPQSGVALAVSAISKERNKLCIIAAAATSDLTGPQCTENTVHWAIDTWMLARSTGGAMVKAGGDTWFFITADFTFGHKLESDTTELIKAANGTVKGSAPYPFPQTTDFSSFLLKAQNSGAKVLGVANSGADTINTIKQAKEFGLTMDIAALLMFISDVNGLGLEVAQGLYLTETFYWDLNEGTRAFTNRVKPKTPNNYPSMVAAGCYAGSLHFMKAINKIGPAAAKASGKAVVEAMKSLPIEDDAFGKGSIRQDGRTLLPAYLFQVKKPSESRGKWDYYKLVQTTPFDQAWRPLSAGGCPFIKA